MVSLCFFMLMKKITFIIALFVSLSCFAYHVTPEKAQTIAQNFMDAFQKKNTTKPFAKSSTANKKMKLKKDAEQHQFYIFTNTEGDGFVIIPKDDAAHPILAYSFDSSWDSEDKSPAVDEWLQAYDEQIISASVESSSDSKIESEWNDLYTKKLTEAEPIVAPLIKTLWGQTPYYNAFCPYTPSLGQAVTGCVATAFAQILKYWDYPERGFGVHTYIDQKYGMQTANFGATIYDWANMPVQLVDKTSIDEEVAAVAQLMYHCGVAVDMGYGPRGSGANTQLIESALFKYFGYSSTAQFMAKANYEESQWYDMLKKELNESRVMIYRGTGKQGGHCFTCDGYDSENRFHFNWGWNGKCNGYFALSAMNPTVREGVQYSFATDQCAIMGIRPLSMDDRPHIQLNQPIDIAEVQEIGTALSGTVQLKNASADDFKGNIFATLYDDYGRFISNIPILDEEIKAGDTKTIEFFFDGTQYLLPGDYTLYISYGTSLDDLQSVYPDKYTNPIFISLVHSADITLMSDINIKESHKRQKGDTLLFNAKYANKGDCDILTVSDTVEVTANIQNFKKTAYTGDIRLAMHPLADFDSLIVLGNYHVDSLESNAKRMVSFRNVVMPETAGTYVVSLQYSDNGTYDYLGSDGYTNARQVILQADTVPADAYEPNNTVETATELVPVFNNDVAQINVKDLTIHFEDFDLFKIDFEPGYVYDVQIETPNTSDKQSACKAESIILSQDDTECLFAVSPQYEYGTCYYDMNVTITREVSTGIAPKTIKPQNLKTSKPYSISGIPVGMYYKGLIINNGKTYINKLWK